MDLSQGKYDVGGGREHFHRSGLSECISFPKEKKRGGGGVAQTIKAEPVNLSSQVSFSSFRLKNAHLFDALCSYFSVEYIVKFP